MQRVLPRSRSSSRKSNQTNSDEVNQLRLEKVFGFTIQNNACVALDSTSGIIAFPAGCVVVGYSPKRSKPFFIHNSTKSPLTSLAFSKDGKLLATGESGKAPKVRIWDIETRTQVAEFNGHNYKVGALTFIQKSRFIVSVGSQEDMTINVWEMSSNLKIATSRVTSKVNAITYCEAGNFFVTVGVRHVRFWYLESSSLKTKTTTVLSGRNALLGDLLHNTFNDVGCCCLSSNSGVGQMTSSMCSSFSSSNCQSYTYVISQAGQLIQFSEQRSKIKCVELQTSKATCLTVCESYIIIGCSRGIILLYDTASLSHLSTLPKPHSLGINIQTENLNQNEKRDFTRYPDVIAAKYDYIHSRITSFYNDHSIYVWDLRNYRHPLKVTSHLFHSGGVWSVEPVPLSQGEGKGILDVSSFITCSDDETVRFWYLPKSYSKLSHSQGDKLPSIWHNDHSKELLKIIYTDPHLKCLTASDRFILKNSNQSNDVNVTLKHGIRSIKISPDRQQLATADREGNLRFYSMADCKELYSIAAHNGEILSIDYFQSSSSPDLILFCSASRDRIIHVMDPSQGYKCIQTIDDHSGTIFSVKFVETPSDQEIRLISCGTDKSLLFRILQPDESGQTAQFFLNQHLIGKQSQYDMVIAPNNRYAVVACQDRQVRIYNLVTGKQRKSYRGSHGDDGNLVRCAIDPSGTYLATSGSDKYLHILNFTTGEILASITGHSEMALGICFLNDLKHLVSVSSDNCIFVWRLPVQMTLTMHQRMKDLGSPNYVNFRECDIKKDTAPPSTCGTVTPPAMSDEAIIEPLNLSISTSAIGDNGDTSPSSFRFSVSALPSWAQKKFSRRDSITFVQVNMMHEFCSTMSTVDEKKDENNLFDETCSKDENLSRRISFIATEKVVRDDDSDNIEDEDSEWFGIDKINFERSMDLESILQQVNSRDEEDEEENDESFLNKNPQSRSSSLEDEETHREHCAFVVNLNKTQNKDGANDIMSTSAPSTLTTWVDEGSYDSYTEDGHINDSEIHNNDCRFPYDDASTLDDITITSSGLRGTLTTRYLTKSSAPSNIVNYQYKVDNASGDKSFQKPTETSSRKINVPVQPFIMKKSFPAKSRSEVNVSHVGAVRKKSDTIMKPINNQSTMNKVNFSYGKHTQDRSESRDRKQNEKKSKFNNSADKKTLSKSISTVAVSSIDQIIETKPKSNSMSQTSTKLTENKTASSNSRSTRPKWADKKKSRDMRKTCPVEMKDIKAASARHSLTKSEKVVESVSVQTQNAFLHVDLNKAELQSEPLNTIEENKKLKHTLTKTATVDLQSCHGKEHVIDEIEELPGSSLNCQRKSQLNLLSFEEMLNILSIQNQTESREVLSLLPNVTRTEAIGGECIMRKSIDLDEIELCTDEWIEELCGSHNLDFLTTMVSKILRRLIDAAEITNESQRHVAIRLLTEIDIINQQLRSTLDIGPLSLDNEDTANLIKDIGERIVDEVKRRLSESL